ncbi:hypothetical protein [Parafrankia sp. FMc2]|uniref:hypothetical protein n=1 Tax=Parafrankia sp. FMc2 TaxID=3233196 RepID=UPI0034D66FC3
MTTAKTPARLAGMTPRQIADLGAEHGWEVIEASHWLTLRRIHLMSTPEYALHTPEGRMSRALWLHPTYHRPEFLTFRFREAGTTDDGKPRHRLYGQVIHREGRPPWVEAHDGSVSQARALEILTAAPPADALTPEGAEAAGGAA